MRLTNNKLIPTDQLQTSVSAVEPTAEPITVAEAKKHLEIADADTRHDSQVERLITAARQKWEKDTDSIATLPREVTENHFNILERIRLSLRPLVSVTSVKVNGSDLASSVYRVDFPRRMIHFDSVPSVVDDEFNTIEIKYEAGHATPMAIGIQAMLLQVSIMFDVSKPMPHYHEAYENILKNYLRPTYP